MLKKILFFLSLVIFIMTTLYTTNIVNGVKTSNALYKDTTEIHVQYKNNLNYNDFVNDVYAISQKTNSNISQYSFTDVNQLTILSTNPRQNKLWNLTEGKFPQPKSESYVTNTYPGNDKKQSGILKLPNSFLTIKLYPFSYTQTIGLGNIFYVQGDGDKVDSLLKNYGETTISQINKSDTYQIDANHTLLLVYVFLFLCLAVFSLAFTQIREQALKRIFGYSLKDIWIDCVKDLKCIFYPLLIMTVSVIFTVLYFGNLNIFYGLLFCYSIYFFAVFLYTMATIIFYRLSNIKNILKNAAAIRFTLVFLNIILCVSLIIFISVSLDLKKVSRQNETMSSKLWKETTTLYKTNITNQLNRENPEEETEYLKKASVFYSNISSKYPSFIIAPYNYATIDYKEARPYVGQEVFPNKEDYITEPSGAGIAIDRSYLTYNPIQFSHKEDIALINKDPMTQYVLVPEKYKKYAEKIQKNYLDDLKFRLEDAPTQKPYDKVDLSKLNVKLIYTKNNQKYFTYNPLYGRPEEHYRITDPLVSIVNPSITNSLFWGNILTSSGGLYFNFDKADNDSFFKTISSDIKAAGLTNTINFSYSVFQELGEIVAQRETQLLNVRIRYIISFILFMFVSFQIVLFNFKIYSKKIMLKKVLGYSYFSQISDLFVGPLILELFILFVYQFIYREPVITFPLVFLLLTVNLTAGYVIYKKYSLTYFKEHFA